MSPTATIAMASRGNLRVLRVMCTPFRRDRPIAISVAGSFRSGGKRPGSRPVNDDAGTMDSGRGHDARGSILPTRLRTPRGRFFLTGGTVARGDIRIAV